MWAGSVLLFGVLSLTVRAASLTQPSAIKGLRADDGGLDSSDCTDDFADADAEILNLTVARQPDGMAITAPPTCGGVYFFHLPKTGGSSFQNVLYEQPEWSCCFNGYCGACHERCQNREHLAGGIWNSITDLASNPGLLGVDQRFVTTLHGGPDRQVPGLGYTMQAASDEVVSIAQLNVASPGCAFKMMAILRHPAAQLLSCYHYTADTTTTTLDDFAAQFPADSLIGVGSPAISLGWDPNAHAQPNSSAVVASLAKAEEMLWSRFQLVGHTERFEATLLRAADLFGLRHLMQQAVPDNTGPCFRSGESTTAVDSGEYSDGEWNAATALRPDLIGWYTARLAKFDSWNAGDVTFASRLTTLKQARASLAAEQAPPQNDRPCSHADLLVQKHRV